MVTVCVDNSSLHADSQSKSVGLVSGSAATVFIAWNEWTFVISCHDDSSISTVTIYPSV